jgi:hypothetical protein
MSQTAAVTLSHPSDRSSRRDLVAAVLTGQIAGLVMAVVVMAVFTIVLGKSPLLPVQVIGSFIFGEAATTGFQLPALLAGLVLHQGAALAWSLVFAVAARRLASPTLVASVVLGTSVGLLSQLIDVNLIMPTAMNAWHGRDLWALHVPAFWSWAAHLVFGLSFAVYPVVVRRLSA